MLRSRSRVRAARLTAKDVADAARDFGWRSTGVWEMMDGTVDCSAPMMSARRVIRCLCTAVYTALAGVSSRSDAILASLQGPRRRRDVTLSVVAVLIGLAASTMVGPAASAAGIVMSGPGELFPVSFPDYADESRDGRPVSSSGMWASDLAVTTDGSLLVAGGKAVHRLGLDGIITDVAGINHRERASDTPALRTEIQTTAIAATADGGFIVGNSAPTQGVLRVWPDQRVSSIWSGYADAIAALPDGSTLVRPSGGAIVEVGRDGVVHPFAGTGEEGFSGDGGPATRAQLASPQGFAALPDGTVLIADSGNDRVRRVDRSGRIDTVVDTESPLDVVAAPDGGFYVAGGAGAIARYSADGALVSAYASRTFGRPYPLGGFSSRQSSWRPLYPARLAVLPDGNLAFVDSGELWVMAFGPMSRVAVSIRNLSVARGMITATIASTAGGTATLGLQRLHGRGERMLAREPLAPGLDHITFRGRLPAGERTLLVQLTDAANRIAGDRVEALLRPRLRIKDARAATYRALSETAEYREVRRCRRFSPRRVDCVIYSQEYPRRPCWRVAAITLPRTGLPQHRLYRCRSGTSPFRADPWPS